MKLGCQQQFRSGRYLARGLNYYRSFGRVAPAKEVAMGSIGGGGRYDDLTGILA
jgi:histidyl-tRNA synthetase